MDLLPLISTVFIASILGSLHCAGMCGAFVLFAVADPRNPGPRLRLHVAYHAGRLITYTILGALAGLVGASLDLGGSIIGVQRFAAIVAGCMMVVFGVVTVMRLHSVRVPKLPIPKAWQNWLIKAHGAVAAKPPVVRALATGLLTTLLPCGWLYSFVLMAAGTARADLGAITMAVFWLGTVPILAGLGVTLRAASGSLGRRLPTITAVSVVVVGLSTVVWRAQGVMGETTPEKALHCPLCKDPP